MSQTTTTQTDRERLVDPDARAPFGVGLLKGLAVTVKHLFKTPSTQMYPKVKPVLPPRTRGVIALMDENCTVCMLCARECPDWCIYIDSHKETVPPAKEGGRARTRNVLDRFAIDFALCMYCGICVEVCPFDALFWSPEFEYCEYSMDGLLHEMDKLREWADTVPPPPPLEDGADTPAEVADAISKKNAELDAAAAAAEQQAIEQQQAEKQAAAPAAKAGGGGTSRPRPTLADMEIEGEPQIDQATFDELIEQGKSERMARSKAKSAWVKAEKQKLLDAAIAEWEAEQASAAAAPADAPAPGAAPSRPRPTLADMEVEGEPQVDQELFDSLVAEGKSERMARSKAKSAWVKAEKQKLLDAAIAEWEAEQAAGGGEAAPAADSAAAAAADAEAPAEPAAPKLADVHVEGAGEIDQETYDALIAEGKSERIARAKAKAAWVKKRKQEQLDQGGDA